LKGDYRDVEVRKQKGGPKTSITIKKRLIIPTKHRLLNLIFIIVLVTLISLLPACGEYGSYPGHTPETSSSAPTPPPPLNVTIDHIGIKFDHDPLEIQGPGDIYLVIVVSDGAQSIQEILPPGEGNAFYLSDYETTTLNRRVFHTPSSGDYLKVSILAYEDDPETAISDLVKGGLAILGAIMVNPTISGLGSVLSQYEQETGEPLFKNEDDYVGYFEGFWGSDESWGIGQHNAVGKDDFRVWLSIWTDSQPQPMPKPTLIPDIAIENVDMLSQVEVGKRYTTIITLRNNESHSVTVTLKEHSSITGDVSSPAVVVPAKGNKDVIATAHCETPGDRAITYKLFYKGNEIDSWQGRLEATTASALIQNAASVVIQSVDMASTVKVGERHTDTITLKNNYSSGARVTLKGYSSMAGQFFSKTLNIGANSQAVATSESHSETPGMRTITYKLFYNHYVSGMRGKGHYELIEIDSWQRILNVIE